MREIDEDRRTGANGDMAKIVDGFILEAPTRSDFVGVTFGRIERRRAVVSS